MSATDTADDLDTRVRAYANRIGLLDDVDRDDDHEWAEVAWVIARRFDVSYPTALQVLNRVVA